MKESLVDQWIPIQRGLNMKFTVELSGNKDPPITQKFLPITRVRYLEGYLYFKDGFRPFSKFWFVLKGEMMEGASHITKARLFRFRDSQTHVSGNHIDQMEIGATDELEVHKIDNKQLKDWKYNFTLKYNKKEKLQFRARDSIERDRWLYALIDLVSNSKPPSQLPTLQNRIRPKCMVQRRQSAPVVTDLPFQPTGNFAYESPELLSRKGLAFTVPWYYPGMGRAEADLVLQKCQVGTYLLRDNSMNVNNFALSYRDFDNVKHMLIIKSTMSGEYHFDGREFGKAAFPSPEDCVLFFADRRRSILDPKPLLRMGHDEGRREGNYVTAETPRGDGYDRPLPENPHSSLPRSGANKKRDNRRKDLKKAKSLQEEAYTSMGVLQPNVPNIGYENFPAQYALSTRRHTEPAIYEGGENKDDDTYTDPEGYYLIADPQENISMASSPNTIRDRDRPLKDIQHYQNVDGTQLPPRSTKDHRKLFRTAKDCQSATLSKQQSYKSFEDETKKYHNLDANGNQHCFAIAESNPLAKRSPPNSNINKRPSFEECKRLYKSFDDAERYQNVSLSNYKF